MTLELGGDERAALADLVVKFDAANEALHRWVDSKLHPPRTKRARDLRVGDVVQFNDERRIVKRAGGLPGEIHICWLGSPLCSCYRPDAEIALAHQHEHRLSCFGDSLEPVCEVTS